MAQYDGSIRINTKIDSKQASAQLMTLENRIVKTADKIAGLRSKMDALKDTKIPTQEYSEISTQIQKAESEFNKLLEKQEQMQREGKDSGVAWERLNDKMEEIGNTILYAQGELQDLVDTGKAFTLGSDTEEFTKLNQQLKYLESDYSILIQRKNEFVQRHNIQPIGYEKLRDAMEELQGSIYKITHPVDAIKSSFSSMLSTIKNKAAGISANIINGIAHPFQTVKKIAQSSANLAKKALSGLASVAKKTGSSLKDIASKLLGIGKGTKSASGGISSFSNRLKGLVVSALIFNQISKSINAMISGIKEGFSNLYEENYKFKSSVDNLKASVITLKNALASAFSPIVETAIPYIQRLVGWLTKAADAVGQLLAALMGRKTYTKAVKQTAKASEDAADATKKEADATEEAQEAAEGYLSPLDEINKYKEEEVKNSNKTSHEDIEESPVEQIGNMFEEIPISDKFKDIAQWIKDMWANADFTELGTMVGKKLKNALDNIPWDGIKEKSAKIGKSIATLINGFIEAKDLGLSIGNTLAEAINTGFKFLNSFVHNLHWDSVGKFIADTIGGFFTGIDWDLIYDTFVTGAKGLGDAVNSFMDNLNWNSISESVSNFVNTFVDTIYTFITTVKWKDLGNKVGTTISNAWKGIDWKKAGATIGETFKAFFGFISSAIESIDWFMVAQTVQDFLTGIDWGGVASALFEAIGAAFGGFAAFIGELIGNGITAAKEYFQEKIEECGGNIVLGIFKGIQDAISGVAEWITEHILFPFIEGFKKAFGIHSPSTVMAEMGKYIIQGLLNGILSLVGDVKAIWEGMKDTAVNIWNGVKDFLGNTWNSIKQTASQVWDGIKQNLSEKWNNIKSGAKTTFDNVKNGIKESWTNIKSNIKESAENVKTNITNAWAKAKETTASAWNNIKEKAVSSAQSMAGSVRDKFSGMQSAVSNFSSSAQSIWSRAWEGMQGKVGSVLDSVKNTVSSVFGWISSTIGSLGNSLRNLTSRVISSRSTSSYSYGRNYSFAPASALVYQSFAFDPLKNAPIPKLATGAVIPANREFLAVLGDQKHGTNVEAPLDTIRQASAEAVMEVLSELGITGNRGSSNQQTIIIKQYLDGKQVAESVVKEGKIQQMATGNNMFALGTT